MGFNDNVLWIAKMIEGSNRKSQKPYKIQKRAILKNGKCNILQCKISKRRLRYVQDFYTTLVDCQWRWTLLFFAISFIASWLLFSLLWWLIPWAHGDLLDEHLPNHQADSNWKPCVLNIYGYTSSFLFSLETQHTIGYGVRTITEECSEAVFLMSLQSIFGVALQGLMTGIVFAKMTRPKIRQHTLQFSRTATISMYDGCLSLIFRIGDMRKSHLIGANVRAQVISSNATLEGEIIENFQTELKVFIEGVDANPFFVWPIAVVHRIDEDSPFYEMSARRIQRETFEIVVILEGTIEGTGQSVEARTSYIPEEIRWGYKFEPVLSYNIERQGYEINYSKFDSIFAVDTPSCSAAEHTKFQQKYSGDNKDEETKQSQDMNTQLDMSFLRTNSYEKDHKAEIGQEETPPFPMENI